MGSASYPDNVFINCPFDRDYWPLFEVLLFTVSACGFRPRATLEAQDSGAVRLDKIARLISDSRYGIHDVSRVELDGKNRLPRFNMPFELGLDLGCRKFGGRARNSKRILVLDRIPYRYQKFLSDIAGQDIEIHGNNLNTLMKVVRDWLRTVSKRSNIPGDQTIRNRFTRFSDSLPSLCKNGGLDRKSLSYPDYISFVGEWLLQESL